MVEPDRRGELDDRLPGERRRVLEHCFDAGCSTAPATSAARRRTAPARRSPRCRSPCSRPRAAPGGTARRSQARRRSTPTRSGRPRGRSPSRPASSRPTATTSSGRRRSTGAATSSLSPSSSTFTIDNVNPTSTVGFPANGGFYNAGPWAAGCGTPAERHLRHGRGRPLRPCVRPVEHAPQLDRAVLERLELLERDPGVHHGRRLRELVGRLRVLQLPGRRQLHAVRTGDGSRGERGGDVDVDVRRRHDRTDVQRGPVRHREPRLVAQPDRDDHGHGRRRRRHPEDRVPARRRRIRHLLRSVRRDRRRGPLRSSTGRPTTSATSRRSSRSRSTWTATRRPRPHRSRRPQSADSTGRRRP